MTSTTAAQSCTARPSTPGATGSTTGPVTTLSTTPAHEGPPHDSNIRRDRVRHGTRDRHEHLATLGVTARRATSGVTGSGTGPATATHHQRGPARGRCTTRNAQRGRVRHGTRPRYAFPARPRRLEAAAAEHALAGGRDPCAGGRYGSSPGGPLSVTTIPARGLAVLSRRLPRGGGPFRHHGSCPRAGCSVARAPAQRRAVPSPRLLPKGGPLRRHGSAQGRATVHALKAARSVID